MSAAEELLGCKLPDGWDVVEKLVPTIPGSGGNFSQGYKVKKGEKLGFLKAFDLQSQFKTSDPSRALQLLLSAYNHEKDIIDHCNGRRLSNVVTGIGHGNVQVPTIPGVDGQVFYLIFEMADGDVRRQMSSLTSCDELWCLTAFQGTALGLWQLHREFIAHQDTKPSNVLVYGPERFKVADFGRSSRRSLPGPYDGYKIAGDRTYAPPELLYGYMHPDFSVRRIGCDLYMLGSLACFLFGGGVNMTALINQNLDPQHHYSHWSGTYDEVLPFVSHAFTKALDSISRNIPALVRDEMLRIIAELCEPDIARRGHRKGVGKASQYSLERHVSELDNFAKRLRIKMRVLRR